jgi:AhpD family alkylhydroperoxidase
MPAPHNDVPHLDEIKEDNMRLAYDTLAPDGFKALGSVYAYVQRSGLEKPLVDLAYLRASQMNGCAYCIDAHAHDAAAEGASREKLMLVSVWREAGRCFTDRERAALAWSEVVTAVSETHVPEEAFAAAREVFTEKELTDLTLAVGLINVYNRLAISFRRTPASVAKLEQSDA